MSSDFHAKFDGVEGESKHKDHKDEIELITWSWDVTQPTSAASGGGSGKGKAVPGVFKFTHNYDKASPVLAKKSVQGVHFPKVVVTARKAGEGQQEYLTVTFKEVLVTKVDLLAKQGGEVVESVETSYKDIEFAYKAQDDKGAASGEVKFGWDIASTEVR